jgi:hypothetical protein
MKVVAEGVEDGDSYALLRRLGCDTAQGYYMSAPLPPEAFRAWLEGRLPTGGSIDWTTLEGVFPEAGNASAHIEDGCEPELKRTTTVAPSPAVWPEYLFPQPQVNKR